jgi:hypothetical protein
MAEMGHERPARPGLPLVRVRYSSNTDHDFKAVASVTSCQSHHFGLATQHGVKRGYGRLYSITSSAATSSLFGTIKPSDFVVFKLMTSSNLVG